MKRSWNESILVHKVDDLLIQLPLELFLYILNLLPLSGLRLLYQAYEYSKDPSIIERLLVYLTQPTLNKRDDMVNFQYELEKEKLRKMASIATFALRNLIPDKAMKQYTDRIGRIYNDPYCFMKIFRAKVICTHCEQAFSEHILWKTSSRVRTACFWCYDALKQTKSEERIDLEKHKDGWAWVSAKQMKLICKIPSNKKTAEYAKQHQIRTHSSSVMSHSWLLTTTNQREYFFLEDILNHIQ